ncbi:hypothetical protein HZH68_005566 [Vespula germanica]|uniref:Uncharacterized protein n=3 Tax=Vespula TaxID=7451 RepID=A0A834KHT1_VESGE|nr:hypothetical protein HZH68_005566 [Vespula germanica]KAF7429716.1 hypothetical protein H0235_006114 [Vespula pensylvanica]
MSRNYTRVDVNEEARSTGLARSKLARRTETYGAKNVASFRRLPSIMGVVYVGVTWYHVGGTNQSSTSLRVPSSRPHDGSPAVDFIFRSFFLSAALQLTLIAEPS